MSENALKKRGSEYYILLVVSAFRRDVDESCALLGYCAANGGNSLPRYRDNLSVPWDRWPLKLGPIDCPETSVRNYHCSLRNSP